MLWLLLHASRFPGAAWHGILLVIWTSSPRFLDHGRLERLVTGASFDNLTSEFTFGISTTRSWVHRLDNLIKSGRQKSVTQFDNKSRHVVPTLFELHEDFTWHQVGSSSSDFDIFQQKNSRGSVHVRSKTGCLKTSCKFATRKVQEQRQFFCISFLPIASLCNGLLQGLYFAGEHTCRLMYGSLQARNQLHMHIQNI